jgi:NADH-quinone oxidoreductase subunit I
VHYPEERLELPARTRGVIALLEENCTVCMLCSKECPCWCIYIEGHKTRPPEKRGKPVNVLDRFAIDFGLCMYCGICVEVCPFDALHWSPAFEYTSFTYEGLVHERDVLASWEYKVLPPPALVDDADETLRKKVDQEAAKREQGPYGLIREAPKKQAYAAMYGTDGRAPSPAEASTLPVIPPHPRTEAVAEPVAAPAPAVPAAAVATPAKPPAVEAAAPAPQPPAAPVPSAAPAATADLAGVPRIDPNNLPAGIGPVERGRLKKLAHFQEHGRIPPADLLQKLKPILDQMSG